MKTTIFAALLVGIAVAISDHDISYNPGNEYIYELKSQSLTGIPHISAQFSGIRLQAQIKLQIGNRDTAVIQFDDSKFYRLNDVLEDLPIYNIVPESQWQEVDQEQKELYENCFSKPVLFKYTQGIIRELSVDDDESEWCINMKKGVLSLFQMDLSQQNQLEDVDPAIMEQNSLSWDTMDRMFRTMEESIDGDCESVYIVQNPGEYSLVRGEKDTRVTKVRNYDNCRFRPRYEEGMFSSYVVDEQNTRNQTGFRSFSQTNCTIRGERSDFVVKDLKQLSSHFYTPLSEEDGEVATFSVQELKLRNYQQVVVQPPRYTRQRPEGLKMKLSQKSGLQHQSWDNNREFSEERIQAIKLLLSAYVSQCDPIVTRESLETLHRLMFNLRDSSAEEVIEVFKQTRKNSQQLEGSEEITMDLESKALIDILPTLGRPYILQVVKFLMEEAYIKPLQAATIFNYITLTIKPTAEVVEYLLPNSDVYSLPMVRFTPQLRQSMLLALGTVHHGLTKAQKQEPIPQDKHIQVTEKFVQQIEELYQNTKEPSDKFAVLKVIGNCGLPNFIDFVQRILEDQNTPWPLRINAVTALRRVPREFAQRVHSILMPIYRNPQEHYSLRCVAYLGTIKSQPSYGTVQAIVQSLIAEKSQKVGAFVYSHLQDVAESSRLSLNETRRYVRLTMKQAKPFLSKRAYSYSYSLDMLSADLGIGQYLDLYLMDSPRSIFPTGFEGTWGTTVYGRETKLMELGMYVTGVQDILSRLLGPKSILRDMFTDQDELSDKFFDIVKQLLGPQQKPNMGKVDDLIKNVIEKLGLTEQQSEELYYAGFLRILGNELRFWMLNSQDIISWLEENKEDAYKMIVSVVKEMQQEGGKPIDYMQTMTAETSIVIPTQLGIPLYVNESYCHVVRLRGNSKLSGNILSKQTDIILETDGTPSTGVWTRGTMGLYLPLLRAGVSVKNTVQIKDQGRVTINLKRENKELSVKYNIPEEPAVVVRGESVPTTYLEKLTSQQCVEPYQGQEIEIKNPKLVKPVAIKVPYETEIFGMKIVHQLEIPTNVVSYAPVRPFDGKHVYIWERKEVSAPDQYVKFYFQWGNPSENIYRSSQKKYGSYRSSSRSEESEESEEITFEDTESVEVDPSLVMPQRQRLRMKVETRNTPKELDLDCKFTLLSDENQKLQFNMFVNEHTDGQKASVNLFVDLQKIFHAQKSEEPERIAEMKVRCMKEQGDEYYVYMKVKTGDRDTKIELPVEPLYVYKMRQLFNANDIEIIAVGQDQEESYSSHQDEEKSYLSWLTGGKSYSSEEDEESRYHYNPRGMLPLSEIRKYAYKYTMDVDYKLSEKFEQYIDQYFQYMRYVAQDYMVVAPKDQPSAEGKATMVARIIPSMERIHLYCNTPTYETTIFRSLRLPPYLHRALTLDYDLIFPQNTNQEESNPDHGFGLQSVFKQAECSIEDKNGHSIIKTFDGMTYELPQMPDCEVLLARSPSNLFTVLMYQSAREKKLTVVFPNTKVDIMVPKGWRSQSTVLIDGEPLYIPDGATRSITVVINHQPVAAQLKRQGNTILLQVDNLGLRFRCNEQEITISTASWHSGQVQGLCGDYNGDVLREMTGPREQVYGEAKEFGLSYVLSSDTCDKEELKRLHLSNDESCAPEKRTMVLHLTNEQGEEVTCFSQQPVDVCPRGCRPLMKERPERVSFICKPKHSPTTQRMLEDVKRYTTLQLNDYDQYGQPHFQELDIPEQCQPMY